MRFIFVTVVTALAVFSSSGFAEGDPFCELSLSQDPNISNMTLEQFHHAVYSPAFGALYRLGSSSPLGPGQVFKDAPSIISFAFPLAELASELTPTHLYYLKTKIFGGLDQPKDFAISFALWLIQPERLARILTYGFLTRNAALIKDGVKFYSDHGSLVELKLSKFKIKTLFRGTDSFHPILLTNERYLTELGKLLFEPRNPLARRTAESIVQYINETRKAALRDTKVNALYQVILIRFPDLN